MKEHNNLKQGLMQSPKFQNCSACILKGQQQYIRDSAQHKIQEIQGSSTHSHHKEFIQLVQY
jgi:hypothetical protein